MRRLLIVIFTLLAILFPMSVSAHPGNTDSRGCHTCRTNCTEKWGLQYDEYHCHNAKTTPAQVERAIEPIIVSSTPKAIVIEPTPKPTIKLTIKPTEVPISIPTIEPTITPSSSVSPSSTPTPAVRTSGLTKIWRLFLMFLK